MPVAIDVREQASHPAVAIEFHHQLPGLAGQRRHEVKRLIAGFCRVGVNRRKVDPIPCFEGEDEVGGFDRGVIDTVELKHVATLAAVQQVLSRPADQAVVLASAVEFVISGAAIEPIP